MFADELASNLLPLWWLRGSFLFKACDVAGKDNRGDGLGAVVCFVDMGRAKTR